MDEKTDNKPNRHGWRRMNSIIFLYPIFMFVIFTLFFLTIKSFDVSTRLGYSILMVPTIIMFLLFFISDYGIWGGVTKNFTIEFPPHLKNKEGVEWFVLEFKNNFSDFNTYNNHWYEFFLNLEGTMPYHFSNKNNIKDRIYIRLIPENGFLRIILLKNSVRYYNSIDRFIEEFTKKIVK